MENIISSVNQNNYIYYSELYEIPIPKNEKNPLEFIISNLMLYTDVINNINFNYIPNEQTYTSFSNKNLIKYYNLNIYNRSDILNSIKNYYEYNNQLCIDIEKYYFIIRLYSKYKNLCYQYYGWKYEPKNSFSRWLIELKNTSIDPILPGLLNYENIKFDPIVHEICEDFPIKIKPPFAFVNEKNIKSYYEKYIIGYYNLIKKYQNTNDLNYKFLIDYYYKFLELKKINELDKFYNLFVSYKNNVYPKFVDFFKPSAINISKNLLQECDRFVENINMNKIYNNISVVEKINTLEYKNIKLNYNDQIKKKTSGVDINKIFQMLLRYQILNIEGQGGVQAAVPEKFMQYINKNLDVSFECFASPINRYFDSYCSIFYYSDKYFGSKGSFFDNIFVEGFYEVNPPFSENLMKNMVIYIESLLKNTNKPLSFIIILPKWEDSDSIIMLNNSKFLSKKQILIKNEHYYREINQEKYFLAVHDTNIFILQNEEGKIKWKINEEILDGISESFKNYAS